MGRRLAVRNVLVAITVWCMSGSLACGGPRWQDLLPFRRVEANPRKSYRLTDREGPWMVLAASFAGEGAEKDAHELVLELRSRYRLPAYVHKQHFDFRDTVVGKGFTPELEPKRMRYNRSIEFDEIAVLVGNFTSVDDPELQEVLKLIKYTEPKCLRISGQSDTTLRFAGLRAAQRRINGDKEKKQKGPMGSAFVTRNPLLPDEYFAPEGVDQFVMSMNDGVRFSLLDCPGNYTVRVATFRGKVILDQRRISQIEEGDQMKSSLAEGADKAHRLTTLLRRQGVEAYEFHDRHESIVTVGSFDSAGSPRNDGRTEIHAAILRIMQAYGAKRPALPGQNSQPLTGLQPRSLGGIPFDVEPWPVKVPRRSIAADYAGSNRSGQ